jgi:hypothetical protein
MPIEIRELVIRAAVAAPQQRDGKELEALLAQLKSEILQECEARFQEQMLREYER